jgi:hypothetical protein
MTNEDKARAIMQDIKSRKGLGKIWDEYFRGIDRPTQEAIMDAWVKIINEE